LNGKAAEIIQFEEDDKKVITATIPGRSLALVTYNGWDQIEHKVHSNRNAEEDESTVIFARKKCLKKNPPMELLISVMLHKTDNSEWTKEELNPIKNIEILDVTPNYSPLGAIITLADDTKYNIDFADIDGRRTC